MFTKTQNPLMLAVSSLALSIAMATIPVAAQQKPQVPAETLPDVEVSAKKAPKPGSAAEAVQTPPQVEKYQLPVTSTTVTATKIQDQINVVDTEDAIKYEPSLFVRKRNNGDTSPVLATRIWGINSSARTLIYGDDVLLSSLIANNNTIGSPRFGAVSADDIKRIDFLYGPYSAAYPGNSMGGVMLITTQMPEKAVATIKQTESFQQFKWYGLKDTYATHQTSGEVGNKSEAFSWLLSGNFADSHSQPISWITNNPNTNALTAGTTGAYRAVNKLGAAADVVGAGGLLHTQMSTINLKTAVDITPWLTASYTLGYWGNDGKSEVKTFLKDTTGNPTFATVDFSGNKYTIEQQHVTNTLSLKTDTKGEFDWEIIASRYDMLEDLQRNPLKTISNSINFSNYGKATSFAGTNWMNGDVKGIWRPTGINGSHEVSFGVHSDQYELKNPTYALADWTTGNSSNLLYSKSVGQTNTTGIWLQDVWKFGSGYKLTIGGREEFWNASNGYNYITKPNTSSAMAITAGSAYGQPWPSVSDAKFSPKISLNYQINQDWDVTGSFGQAYRFPTVSELYLTSLITNSANSYFGNPNLKPENVISNEFVLQRKYDDGKIRLSIFNEIVNDALITQTTPTTFINPTTLAVSSTNQSITSNVDRVRDTGVELAAQKDNILFQGFQLSASMTWVNSRIQSDTNYRGSITSVVGKKVPYVPEWRSSVVATYKPDDHWSFSLGGRYYGKMYSTLENNDFANNTMGSFNPFLVFDTRIQYKFDENHSIGLGVDNIGNEKYTLYHPFPGRTFMLDGKIKF
jgi:iron complex outermembrane recepter protein